MSSNFEGYEGQIRFFDSRRRESSILLKKMERATRLELGTFGLGILIFDPLFSTLTKSIRKIVRALDEGVTFRDQARRRLL